MDFKQIQELIKLINKSNIGEVTVEEKGFRITVKQKEEPVQHVIAAAPVQAMPAVQSAVPQAASAAPATSASAEKPKAAEAPAARQFLNNQKSDDRHILPGLCTG